MVICYSGMSRTKTGRYIVESRMVIGVFVFEVGSIPSVEPNVGLALTSIFYPFFNMGKNTIIDMRSRTFL